MKRHPLAGGAPPVYARGPSFMRCGATSRTVSLRGKRVLVTRSPKQAGALIAMLRRAGATPIHFPTIELRDPPSWKSLDEAIARIDRYDAVIFGSVNGVERFVRRLRKRPSTIPCRICAIGPTTADALCRSGFRVHLQPKVATSRGLLARLRKEDLRGRRFLYPRSDRGDQSLTTGLRRAGATVRQIAVYATRCPSSSGQKLRLILARGVDIISFASSETARNLLRLPRTRQAREAARKAAIVCIGPNTAKTVRQCGYRVAAVARETTDAGMVTSMIDLYKD